MHPADRPAPHPASPSPHHLAPPPGVTARAHPHARPARRTDGGQVAPLVALLVAAAAGAALLVASLGGVVIDRGRAKHAADAAALAGAVEGEEGARRLAAANGAVLQRFTRVGSGPVVEVTVRHGRAEATSRAEPTVSPVGPPGSL